MDNTDNMNNMNNMNNNMNDGQYPCKETLPYPDLEGVPESASTIRCLSPAYAQDEGELTGVLQYVYQHIIFENLGYDEYAKALLKISITEMKHLELLGSAILQLGAAPVYTALPPYPVNFYSSRCVSRSRTPEKMILDDIAAEKKAIEMYTQMLQCIQDERVASLILRIRMDEEVHLHTFERIYGELTAKR